MSQKETFVVYVQRSMLVSFRSIFAWRDRDEELFYKHTNKILMLRFVLAILDSTIFSAAHSALKIHQ